MRSLCARCLQSEWHRRHPLTYHTAILATTSTFLRTLTSCAVPSTPKPICSGFYPGGVKGGSRGFHPSAAVLKAVLINSASPLLSRALSNMTNSSEEVYSLDSAYSPSSVRALEGHGMMSLARGLGVAVLSDSSTAAATLPTLIMAGLASVPAPAPRPEPSSVTFKGADPTLVHGDLHQYCVDVRRNPAVHNGINSRLCSRRRVGVNV